MAVDPYKYFRVEARELLEQLGQGVLDLEKGVPSADLIARLLRLAHTLKGAARVVKQTEVAEQAHELEDVVTALRASTTSASREQIDRMLALLDDIGARVAALAPARPSEAAEPSRVQLEEPTHVFRPAAEDMQMVADGIAEARMQMGALRPRLDQADRIRHQIELIEDQVLQLRERQEGTADRSRLDTASSLIDELRGRFAAFDRDLAYRFDRIARELEQIGDASARLSLVPASAVFRFLERAARDVAQVLGKRVAFEGRGSEVRVDSGMLEVVQGALLQLVRNAVAHGIEPGEDERRERGKPPDGRVTVAVARRGNWLSFACTDDGRGIDLEAVRRIVEQKGLSPREGAAWDTEALLRALRKGGISTSGTVTPLAGRGVGLDVVREAAERLRGDVNIRTEPGQGTTVELVVPFSVASFQALLVEAADVAAAVPLDAVRRTLRVASDEIVRTAQGEAIVDAGRSIPFAPLGRVLRSLDFQAPAARVSSALVIDSGGDAAAFAVDRILCTATIVARPLPQFAPAAPSVVGVALDTDGQPRLVLDPASLVAEARPFSVPQPEAAASRRSILVVDDSLTTRMLEQSVLESAGYEVELASSGEEGLAKARDGTYALFLVDVEMPGMDGFAFVEQVRADPALRGIPSILVTSRASAEDRARGAHAGAQAYIVKSDFDERVLLEQIKALVR